MKRRPWFRRSQNSKKIDQQDYDWLPELVAIFLATLIVAVFVFVGDSWLRSQIGH
jgi:hypothetical protein